MDRFKFLLITHKTIFLFGLLILLTGILVLTTLFRPQLFGGVFNRFGVLAQQIYQRNIFAEKSSIKLWTENTALKLEFSLTKEDKQKMQVFNKNLGIGNDYLQGISLELDPESIQKLSEFLPVNVALTIEPKRISFASSILPTFASSLIKENKEFATEGGKLKFSKSSDSEFQLVMEDPRPLLKYATESGQIMMSDKLHLLFPILDRVGTIEMLVNGKSVSGSIEIK